MKKITIGIIFIICLFLIIGVIFFLSNNPREEQEEEKKKENSFIGKVIESNLNYIIVEPKTEEIRKVLSDKVSISLGENNDMIYSEGQWLHITYTGDVRETYPSQINVIDIDFNLANSFEIIYTKIEKQGKQEIIRQGELQEYDYSIYSYEGKVEVKIEDKIMPLREALLNHNITMDQIIQKANQDATEEKIFSDIYKDGGSMIYQYEGYTVLKFHTLNGNRDVYIGMHGMEITDVEK